MQCFEILYVQLSDIANRPVFSLMTAKRHYSQILGYQRYLTCFDKSQTLDLIFHIQVLEDIGGAAFTQSQLAPQSYRWFAPELCYPPGVISLASDIYAFGMTILEILTGKQPFASVKFPFVVYTNVRNGQRPERPTDPEVLRRGLDDNIWGLLKDCWEHDSLKRPLIDEVITRLG